MATKKSKKNDVVAEAEVETIAAPEAEAEVVDEKGSVTVLSSRGLAVRSYSKAIHGGEYKKLAKQYADKIGGSLDK